MLLVSVVAFAHQYISARPKLSMSRLTRTMVALAGIVGGVALANCGGSNGGGPPPVIPAASPSVMTATPAPSAGPAKQPTEYRVAFINLMSPLALNADDPVADLTFDQRMDMIIEELKAFNPDLVGFNEASVTKAHGSAAAKLAKELKMEFQYTRANPWFPGQTSTQSDEIAKQIGFEEGEAILSKYPILRYERKGLNPRTSENGEGRAVLHVVVKGPPGLGELDIYITHLTGGSDRVREAQATDFVSFMKTTRTKGSNLIAMGGMSDPVGSPSYQVYQAAGLRDVAGKTPIGTCCRETVIGEQPPLTARTDYLLTESWLPTEFALFGDKPRKRADGQVLYASDHNGLSAVFPITPPESP